MATLSHWLKAIRPKTLSASIAPILLSQSLVWQFATEFIWLTVVMIAICALALQVSANLANDYFDGVNGIDTPARLGPARMVQQGLISAEQIKQAIVLSLSIAFLSGLYLIYIGGWLLALCGLLSLVASLAYSGGKKPLASLAMGEITVFIFFGLLAVAGSFYVQTQTLPEWIIWPAIQMGCLSAAIMLVNNIRDYASDKSVGKNTLVVSFIGQLGGKLLYIILLFIALLCVWSLSQQLSISLFLSYLLLPFSLWCGYQIFSYHGTALNKVLASTAQLTLGNGALLSLDILVRI